MSLRLIGSSQNHFILSFFLRYSTIQDSTTPDALYCSHCMLLFLSPLYTCSWFVCASLGHTTQIFCNLLFRRLHIVANMSSFLIKLILTRYSCLPIPFITIGISICHSVSCFCYILFSPLSIYFTPIMFIMYTFPRLSPWLFSSLSYAKKQAK